MVALSSLKSTERLPAGRVFTANSNSVSRSYGHGGDLIDDDQDVNVFTTRIGGRTVPGLPALDPNRTVRLFALCLLLHSLSVSCSNIN